MNSTEPNGLQITLNGEPYQLAAGSRVRDLVATLGLDIRKVAVERNLAIIPRDAYADTTIMPDDRIEIVGFIGGG